MNSFRNDSLEFCILNGEKLKDFAKFPDIEGHIPFVELLGLYPK